MIRTVKVRKEYDGTVALRALDLEVGSGEVCGLIGPNGAGKTTLLRILATLSEPTCGKAYVDDVDVLEEPERVHRMIGFMPDFYSLYDDMTVTEYVDFYARACGLAPAREREARIKEILGLMDLTTKRDEKVASLSRGMKQRLCLARCLVHDPRVLLLDEPASGLDPRARIDLRNLIRNLRQQGKTILVSSHILAELADFCTSVAIIEKGVLLEAGPVDAILKKMKGGLWVKLTITGDAGPARTVLANIEGVSEVEVSGQELRFLFDRGPDDLARVNRQLVLGGVGIVEMTRERRDLEYIFMRVSGHEVA
ncbi:MAG: ABC transporter ATP-binding protein [Candidatus Riflebacteria bacterium]|nr:ABC transporter ATP-binding protein [Candidatus Riflebacteria bacterium]